MYYNILIYCIVSKYNNGVIFNSIKLRLLVDYENIIPIKNIYCVITYRFFITNK